MQSKLVRTAALAAALVVSACGGGDSGGTPPTSGGGPAPNPTPSPTSTPTSTPTPGPSYTAFADLTGDRSLVTSCVGYIGRGALGVPGLEGLQGHANDGLLTFTQATQSYRVFSPSNASSLFGPGELQASSDPNVIRYARPSTFIPGATETFSLVTPVVGGQTLTYTRNTFVNFNSTSPTGNQAYCITGVPTVNTDLPPTPVVTYTRFAVRGTVFDARSGSLRIGDINSSDATMVVNLTTGNFTFSFAADADFGGGSTRVATYQGSGALDERTSGLSGVIEAPGGPPGFVRGGFFGSQGAEFAYVFSYGVDQDFNGINELYVVGTVTGRR